MTSTSLHDFLSKRGLSDEIVSRISQEKIDCDAIVVMTDEELAKYIHAYGDRVAVMAFAKCKTEEIANSNSGCSTGLLDGRLKQRRGPPKGNKNAFKKLRRIDMGWLNRKSDRHTYKQVRTMIGGGTRMLSLERNTTMAELKDTAVGKFFPEGKSKLGNLEEFNNIELRDFKGDLLPLSITIEELYQSCNLKLLKAYIYTTQTIRQASSTSDLTAYETETSHEIYQSQSTTEIETDSEPVNSPTHVAPGIDSGTPEVNFHPRHRLSRLSRTQMSTPSSSLQRTNSFREQMQTEVIDILDSEDEEIQQAIQASYLDCCEEEKEVSTLQEEMEKFQSQAVENTTTKLIVFRNEILKSAIRAVDRTNINLKGKLFIKFSGEIGEDHGGPRREFFRLVIEEMKNSKYFEGPDDSKVFTHNIDLLEKQEYQMIGRLVALAIAQDGPGLHFMNEQMYNLMVGERAPDLANTKIILHEGLNQLTQELEDVDTEEKRDKFLSAHGDSLVDLGFGCPYSLTLSNKGELLFKIKKFYLFFRIAGEISQFKQGMNEVSGAWNYIQENAEVFKPLFCYRIKQPCIDEIMDLFTVNYSINGSNARTMEDATIYAWEMFLQSIEEKDVPVTFGELLSFVTGADHIPPCGFSKKIEIDFYTDDLRFPHVSTCSLQIWLPRATSPEKLSNLLIRALKESRGFLKV